MNLARGGRPLDISVIGTGISGIVFSYYFTQFAKRGAYKLRLFEKADDLGGWLKTHKYVLKSFGQEYEFQTGARSASLSTGNALPLLNIVTRLNLQNKVLVSGKFSSHLHIRRIYYKGDLVKLPNFSASSILFPSGPFDRTFIFRWLFGNLRMGKYPDFSLLEFPKFDSVSIDEIIRKSFGNMIADYVYNPVIHGIAGASPKVISGKIFLTEFSQALFQRKFFRNHDLPEFNVSSSLFKGYKSIAERQSYAQIFDRVYWNSMNKSRCRIWGYDGGFYALLKDVERELINNGVEMHYGSGVTAILPQYLRVNTQKNFLLNQSRCRSLQKLYPVLPEESDGAIDIYMDDGSCRKSDVVVSTLSLKDMVTMLPVSKVENILKEAKYVSIVQISFVHYTANLKRNYDGFGFLVPELHFSELPILGCIYNNNTFTHGYKLTTTELERDYSPVQSFTVLANKDILMREGYDPESEEDCLKLCKKIGLLFGTTEVPLLIHKVFLNDSIPIFDTNYPRVKTMADQLIENNFPGTHVIGNMENGYSINSLTRLAADKAYEVAKQHDLLGDDIINSYLLRDKN